MEMNKLNRIGLASIFCIVISPSQAQEQNYSPIQKAAYQSCGSLASMMITIAAAVSVKELTRTA
jgi:hypothetical protein